MGIIDLSLNFLSIFGLLIYCLSIFGLFIYCLTVKMIKLNKSLKTYTILLTKLVTLAIFFQCFLHVYFEKVQNDDFFERSVNRHGSDPQICNEKRNFVFIKCMKCATETLGTIFRRFGLKRVLNFVVPVKNNIYLGWPYIMEKSDYRPSKWPYNIIMEHSIYNHTVMTSLMPNDTVYITSIREPWKRLISSYKYFATAEIAEVPGGDFTEYIRNIEKYEKSYIDPKKHKLRHCIADNFSLVKNLQGHCLGMPLGFPEGRANITNNLTAIKQYIEHIEKQFSLVMIVEYFYESLILLKRIMCWKLEDITYHISNVEKNKTNYHKGDNFNIYKNFSHVDFVLYDHFNKTFWKKVEKEGPDFYDEVDQFKLIQMIVQQFCFVEGNTQTHGKYLTIPKSRFNEEFNITSEECNLMTRFLLMDIREQYDQIEKPEKLETATEWQEPLRGCSYPIQTKFIKDN